MSGGIGVIGYGAVGAATVERLARRGPPCLCRPAASAGEPAAGRRIPSLRRARRGERASGGRRPRAGRVGDRLPLCRSLVARSLAADNDQRRRRRRGRRRPAGVLRQSLHVRPADGAVERGDAAPALWRQAGGAGRGDPHLAGGERGRTAARRGAARTRLLRAGRDAQPSRRHGFRRHRARRPRFLHRLARHAARFRLCAGLRPRRGQPARRARRRLRPGLACPLRADPQPTRNPRARRGGDRRRAEGGRPAAGAGRTARPVRPAAARTG